MSRQLLIYLLALGGFMVGTVEVIITGIIDMIAKDLHVSTSLAGQLVTGFSLAFAIGSPVVLAFTIRMERKKLLISALLLFALGNLLTFLSPTFSVLMLSRMVLGLVGGIYWIVALHFATELVAPEKKGSAIGTVLMGFSTSLVLGVPAGTMLSDAIGWRYVFAMIAICSVFSAVCLYIWLPVLNRQGSVSLRKQFSILANKKIVTALASSFCFLVGYSMVYSFLTPFLQTSANMTTKAISATLLATGIASVAGSKVGGYASDKWGIQPTLYASLLVHAVMLLVLPVTATTLIGTIVSTMIWVCAVQTTVPAQQYYLMTLASESSESALSINTSVFQLGLAIGAGLGGLVASLFSVLHLGWIAGIIVLLGLGMERLSFSFKRT